MKHLKWLYGSALIAGFIGLGSNFVLKALGNHAEATLLDQQTRGGIVGAITGIAFAIVGTPAAKKKASGWRERLASAAKKKG